MQKDGVLWCAQFAGDTRREETSSKRLTGGEVVKHDDVVGAVCRQMLYEINTYEAGSPCYK
jgi:hypothetical protein